MAKHRFLLFPDMKGIDVDFPAGAPLRDAINNVNNNTASIRLFKSIATATAAASSRQ